MGNELQEARSSEDDLEHPPTKKHKRDLAEDSHGKFCLLTGNIPVQLFADDKSKVAKLCDSMGTHTNCIFLYLRISNS